MMMERQRTSSHQHEVLTMHTRVRRMASKREMYICSLPPVAKQHAAEYLHENEEKRDSDICHILDWLQGQSHLHARRDPVNVVRFLRGCKFDLEKTKRKLSNYYELRAHCPEWFSQRDPCLPEIQELLQLGVFLPLRRRDSHGRLVVLIRAAVHDPKKHRQSDVFKVGKMTLELALEDDETVSVFGVAAVFDLSGVTLGHAMQLPPHVVKKAVHAWQNCYPVRTKSLDFVNAPPHVNIVLNIFRRFMTEKLRQRVHVHGCSLASLHTVVEPELLPREYGGTDGTLQDLIDFCVLQITGSTM
ncbi:retinol-binding protein pinta isoform X2 [Zootermopsis nevadensis]|uniref:retinol-binding protein pinta isoform X2 n=1 Tax=Zootermopsis nevadensis TaxID=136037 RepID=UPI000B8E3573|nr:retinol-binding protein pinta isoform X2 [Zootermopsis nevadensis]XP_021930138.1 retinol-binding protein pinta isoform X2 [Zootermopsis nevadensis]XP_021930140.1 retinol-binding protein pinta isoform X2 [Zootermopsis nevadensis]